MLHERLPGISETARIFAGVDVTREPIPVLPTVHYNMGGIPTNYHGEVINPTPADPEHVVPGLMAIGEAACVSVHGANRLGSQLAPRPRRVRPRRGACARPSWCGRARRTSRLPNGAGEAALARLDRVRNAKGRLKTRDIRLAMQRTMQSDCAVFRTAATLAEGVHKITDVAASMAELGITDRSMIWNTDLVEAWSSTISWRRRSWRSIRR